MKRCYFRKKVLPTKNAKEHRCPSCILPDGVTPGSWPLSVLLEALQKFTKKDCGECPSYIKCLTKEAA
jgi:hypothetical protein